MGSATQALLGKKKDTPPEYRNNSDAGAPELAGDTKIGKKYLNTRVPGQRSGSKQ